jgi:O-antigen/teichoic acid export membrane protein
MELNIKTLLKKAGVNKYISFTVFTRLVNVFLGLGLIYFVSRFMSAELQGYYYTLYSLIAIQVFVELGLNYAIIQFASHEMANLEWSKSGVLLGDLVAKKRLQSLLVFSFRWFLGAGLIAAVLLTPLGLYFFKKTASTFLVFQASLTWVLILISTIFIFFVNACLALLEGCNRIIDVALIRFLQIFVSTLVISFALALNFQLYSLAIGSAVSFVIGIIMLWIKYRIFFKDLWSFKHPSVGMSWKTEIWPFQWKIAISWISGYLIFQIFNPLLFASHGPVLAGQMGMSLQIINAINGLFIVWMTTKAPSFGQLIANGERNKLNILFNNALKTSLCLMIIFLCFLNGFVYLISVYLPNYSLRILAPEFWIFLSLTCLANHILFSEAIYLRAHKEEPLMLLSIGNATVTTLLAFILIPSLGAWGAVISLGISSIFIGFLGGTAIFIEKKKLFESMNDYN